MWPDRIDYPLCSTISSNLSSQTTVIVYSNRGSKALLSRLHPSAHRLRVQHLGHNFKSQHREDFEITEKSGTNHSSAEMFNTLGWQTVTQRHNYNKAVLVYKALNDLTPSYISDLLTPVSQLHHRTLRSTTNGSLAVPR